MKTPLPQALELESSRPANSHTGLWFDKFCNQWCQNPGNKGPAAWSLKAFSEGEGKNRREVNPKMDWIRTVAGGVGSEPLLQEHASRLAELARRLGGRWLIFKTASRLATGLGREHPVENGFAWHPVLGTPYLPGSSVKGLVRAWAATWRDPKPDGSAVSRIFGPRGTSSAAHAGAVIFLDAIPTAPVRLKADVMTPHYGDYYEGKKDKERNLIPPADWLSPSPIPFLTVAPRQLFQFALVARASSEQDRADSEQAVQWLEEALTFLGAGAKTAVGYGRFERDADAEVQLEAQRKQEAEKAQEARLEAERKAAFEEKLAILSPIARELEKAAREGKWEYDKGAFAREGVIESWLERLEKDPKPDAPQRFREIVDRHFPGLLANPDKTEGRKNKPAFKERQRQFARRLNLLLKSPPRNPEA